MQWVQCKTKSSTSVQLLLCGLYSDGIGDAMLTFYSFLFSVAWAWNDIKFSIRFTVAS